MRGLSTVTASKGELLISFPPYARLINVPVLLVSSEGFFPAVCAAYQLRAQLLHVPHQLSRRMRGLSISSILRPSERETFPPYARLINALVLYA